MRQERGQYAARTQTQPSEDRAGGTGRRHVPGHERCLPQRPAGQVLAHRCLAHGRQRGLDVRQAEQRTRPRHGTRLRTGPQPQAQQHRTVDQFLRRTAARVILATPAARPPPAAASAARSSANRPRVAGNAAPAKTTTAAHPPATTPVRRPLRTSSRPSPSSVQETPATRAIPGSTTTAPNRTAERAAGLPRRWANTPSAAADVTAAGHAQTRTVRTLPQSKLGQLVKVMASLVLTRDQSLT
jgi:hypothetical protein